VFLDVKPGGVAPLPHAFARRGGRGRTEYASFEPPTRVIGAAKAAVMAANEFEMRRLSGAIGAEIFGIDLSAEPGDNVIGEIRQVWLDHGVIFFHDQDLPPAKFLAFAKRFGEVVEYPFIKGIEGLAGVLG
jgi:4-hydroxy-L-threonine phosphate dehydrogenase PdxA